MGGNLLVRIIRLSITPSAKRNSYRVARGSPIPAFPKGKEFHQRPIQNTTSPIPAFPKGKEFHQRPIQNTTAPSQPLHAPSQPSQRGRRIIKPPQTQQEETPALWGGLESGPRRYGEVCGLDYHFAIFHHEKYKKHSFCVGFHHFFYNFAPGKRDSASPCCYFSRLGAQFYSYGSYINKPTK